MRVKPIQPKKFTKADLRKVKKDVNAYLKQLDEMHEAAKHCKIVFK